MSIVTVIFTAIAGFDLVWLVWADRQLRASTAGRWRTLGRIAAGVFAVFQLAWLFFAVINPRAGHGHVPAGPVWTVAAVYIWGMVVLPLVLATMVIFSIAKPVARRTLKVDLSRRRWLQRSLVAAGPVLTAAGAGTATAQLGNFRIRRQTLVIPSLPKNLDGLRITQVSDLHLGRWTMPGSVDRLVSAVNSLGHDLIVFTGDLIDWSLADLPTGIQMLRRFEPRQGMAIIEGNHDLFQSADQFDDRMKSAGLPLLVDESATFGVRGERVQMLGMRWGNRTGDRRLISPQSWSSSLHDVLLPMRTPGAFPILLAHHPHVFDLAAAAGLPLTLSGHTHGGQLNLTREIGMGHVFYRYWSGPYEKLGGKLFVNNGVGNWFPLRINAPAEIVELTLRRGE
jgi:predicted MPP superfamily phosphohydrolase